MENAITAVCAVCFGGLALLVKWVRLRGIRRVWYSPVGRSLRLLQQILDNAENWQFRHAVISPFGITAMALLVTHFAGEDYRPVYKHVDKTAEWVDVSALLYGMLAVVLELGGRILFWALAQRKKERDAMTAEVRASVLAEIRDRAAELPNSEEFITLLDDMGQLRVDSDGTVWRRLGRSNDQ